jgi:hypothetical protein
MTDREFVAFPYGNPLFVLADIVKVAIIRRYMTKEECGPFTVYVESICNREQRRFLSRVPSEKYDFATDMATQLTGNGNQYYDLPLLSIIRVYVAKIRELNAED